MCREEWRQGGRKDTLQMKDWWWMTERDISWSQVRLYLRKLQGHVIALS